MLGGSQRLLESLVNLVAKKVTTMIHSLSIKPPMAKPGVKQNYIFTKGIVMNIEKLFTNLLTCKKAQHISSREEPISIRALNSSDFIQINCPDCPGVMHWESFQGIFECSRCKQLMYECDFMQREFKKLQDYQESEAVSITPP